jgi:hypothetical protein
MIVTYVILIGGGFHGWRLGLLGMRRLHGKFRHIPGFHCAGSVPDHCMVASWHLSPLCGRPSWDILVTSPEVLIFALFMIPDPERSRMKGRAHRFRRDRGAVRVLLGPTTEF